MERVKTFSTPFGRSAFHDYLMYIVGVIDVYASRDTPFALTFRTYPAPPEPIPLVTLLAYIALDIAVPYIFKRNHRRRLPEKRKQREWRFLVYYITLFRICDTRIFMGSVRVNNRDWFPRIELAAPVR